MPTWNKELHSLSREDVETISLRFLMGWHDFIKDGHTFRLKGFNRIRVEKMGLEPLTTKMSDNYRVEYIKCHFTDQEIVDTLRDYLMSHTVADSRWVGIELFDCRFGREYARLFRQILGSPVWRKLSEETRVSKLIETQTELYGGVGVSGKPTYDKMIQTKNQMTFAMLEQFRQGSNLPSSFFGSMSEEIVFYLLVDKFGKDDVFYQYGIHPKDDRYPYPCDFYIKSLDLFIELNVHYLHGDHWFDENNPADLLCVKHIRDHGNLKRVKGLKTWCVLDLEKRHAAQKSGINYLVFWDGSHMHDDYYHNGKRVRAYRPVLSDFYNWFYDYGCDYKSFITDHPENTY